MKTYQPMEQSQSLSNETLAPQPEPSEAAWKAEQPSQPPGPRSETPANTSEAALSQTPESNPPPGPAPAIAREAGLEVVPPSTIQKAVLPPSPPKFNLGVIGTAEELSPEEYIALLTNEQIIQDEFRNSIDVGLALAEIRDRRLYRIEYNSFPEYYRKKWHFQKWKVHALTATADVYKSITAGTDLPKPANAWVLRPLLALPLDNARPAWQHAVEKADGRQITERIVRAAVTELQLKPTPEEAKMTARRERAVRRQQLTQAMTDLLELIMGRKPHEELIQKASLLDQHVRFFFPKRRKR